MHFFDPITDFIFIEHEAEAADVIFIPGGPCGEIALHAAELYHQGYAPLLIPSGKHSILDPVYRVLSHRKNTVDENSRRKQIFSQRSFWIRVFLPPVSDRSARLLSLMRMPSIPESLRMRSVLPSGRQSFPVRPITHGVHSFTIRLFFRIRRFWSPPPSHRESERKTGS